MKTVLHTIDVTGSGGAETVFLSLIKKLDKKSYKSIVVIPGHGWLFDRLKEVGVIPIIIEMDGAFNFRLITSLVEVVRRHQVDLIQSHLFGSNLYCSIVGLITSVKVVSTFHGAIDIEGGALYRRVKTFLINLGSERVICVSEFLQRKIVNETLIKRNKTDVIYNGVDVDSFIYEKTSVEIKKNLLWDDDIVLVGLLGNLNYAKAYEVIIDVAELLKDEGVDFRFVIAGDTGHEVYIELQDLIEIKGLQGKVKFIGYVDDVAKFMSELDVYAICSESEGFSLSVIEAMAASCPVVSTCCGGPEEIIDNGQDGVLVGNGDSEELARTIIDIVNDDEKRSLLVNNARIKVNKKFSEKNCIDKYDGLYRSILERENVEVS